MNHIVTTLFLWSFAVVANAGSAQPTIYDDGRSCPGGCDAHVVFHGSINGTKHVHLPGTKTEKCLKGENCEVCFDHNRKQCVIAKFRGGGPPKHKFDFTKAYYLEKCTETDLPDALKNKCSGLKRNAEKIDGYINCIANRGHELCGSLMQLATGRKESDTLQYFECIRVGQGKYNEGRAISEHRIFGCAYEKEKNGGPNSNGTKWHKLLPGACRQDDFVGKHGLDCCSGNSFIDASLSGCLGFYPKPE